MSKGIHSTVYWGKYQGKLVSELPVSELQAIADSRYLQLSDGPLWEEAVNICKQRGIPFGPAHVKLRGDNYQAIKACLNAAYHKLAKAHHPDVSADDCASKVMAGLNEFMSELEKALDALFKRT